MKKLFYCFENDEYITSEKLCKYYIEFDQNNYESFIDYISACMEENNGSLTTIERREKTLKNRLAKLDPNSEFDIYEVQEISGELCKLYDFKSKNSD